jgi:hypothetical protein
LNINKIDITKTLIQQLNISNVISYNINNKLINCDLICVIVFLLLEVLGHLPF